MLLAAALGAGASHAGPVAEALTAGAAAFDRGDFDQALLAFVRAREASPPQASRDRVTALNGEASTLRRLGRLAEARATFEAAFAAAEGVVGPEDPLRGTLHDNRALVRNELADNAGAERDFEAGLRIREAALPPGHEDILTSRLNLAAHHLALGRLLQSESRYRALIAQLEPKGASEELAIAWNGLGEVERIRRTRASVEVAVGHYEKAAAMWQALHGPDHRERSKPLNNLGVALSLLDREEEAAQALGEALRIKGKHLGPEHPSMGASLHNLGEIYLDQGKPVEAVDLLERALSIAVAAKGRTHFHAGLSGRQLALALARAGHLEDARTRHRVAMDVLRLQQSPAEIEQAEVRFREAVEQAPRQPMALKAPTPPGPGPQEEPAPDTPADPAPAASPPAPAKPTAPGPVTATAARSAKLQAAYRKARALEKDGQAKAAYELALRVVKACAEAPALAATEARAAYLAGRLALGMKAPGRARKLLRHALARCPEDPQHTRLRDRIRALLAKVRAP